MQQVTSTKLAGKSFVGMLSLEDMLQALSSSATWLQHQMFLYPQSVVFQDTEEEHKDIDPFLPYINLKLLVKLSELIHLNYCFHWTCILNMLIRDCMVVGLPWWKCGTL